jgi:hypothetical protein
MNDLVSHTSINILILTRFVNDTWYNNMKFKCAQWQWMYENIEEIPCKDSGELKWIEEE